MTRKNIYIAALLALGLSLTGCSFLDSQVPQGVLTPDQIKDPKYIDDVIISAYAGLVSIEDMNSSFSLWNYDTRSGASYVGGSNLSVLVARVAVCGPA